MGNEALEGQMPLFETPKKIEDEPSLPKKTNTKKTPRAAAKREPMDANPRVKPGTGKTNQKSRSKKKGTEQVRPTSGQVPEGDVRLTANIREDLHLKLKIAAAQKRTTIGELIEMLVAKHLK